MNKWVERYDAAGAAGTVERSRRPTVCGHAMAPAVRDAILTLRRTYPHWGPRKLATILTERQPQTTWPAPVTNGRAVAPGRIEYAAPPAAYLVPLTQPLAAAHAPNDVWTADFKGWFRTGDGTRCDPLTVADACSRFVLCCRIVAPTGVGVRPWF